MKGLCLKIPIMWLSSSALPHLPTIPNWRTFAWSSTSNFPLTSQTSSSQKLWQMPWNIFNELSSFLVVLQNQEESSKKNWNWKLTVILNKDLLSFHDYDIFSQEEKGIWLAQVSFIYLTFMFLKWNMKLWKVWNEVN